MRGMDTAGAAGRTALSPVRCGAAGAGTDAAGAAARVLGGAAASRPHPVSPSATPATPHAMTAARHPTPPVGARPAVSICLILIML
jgi:hypothetical protein